MLPLFSQLRPVSGWKAHGRVVGSKHTHSSGWRIEHCGHATANMPWMVWTPEGQRLHTEYGRAWAHLPTAKEAVEAILRGDATTREDEKGRLIFSPPPQPTANAPNPAP